jgi:hypothetical protein
MINKEMIEFPIIYTNVIPTRPSATNVKPPE